MRVLRGRDVNCTLPTQPLHTLTHKTQAWGAGGGEGGVAALSKARTAVVREVHIDGLAVRANPRVKDNET